MNLLIAQTECERHLQEMESLFKPHCLLTLVMRNPETSDGDLIFSRDDLRKVEEAIRKLRERESKTMRIAETPSSAISKATAAPAEGEGE